MPTAAGLRRRLDADMWTKLAHLATCGQYGNVGGFS